jgi:exodeoxyribonuclease VII large subunit
LDSLEQAGEGEILAILEKRKRSLAAEGLFDLDRKKALPKWPWHIALVTSPTGAAVRDILQILRRRAPKIRLTILPTAVQGEGAGQQIAARIKQANVLGLGEVIIVGRGGGSLEDLLPFSEEVVIRAIAASHIPVISAVGHEIDWALSDYVADLRAPTPSAAAELVSANHGQEEQTIAHFRTLAKKDILDRLAHSRLLCKPFKPENLELAFRSIYQPRLVRLDDAREELYWQFKKSLQQKRTRVLQAKTILESTNPKEVLSRGFAIVRERQTGNILRSGHGLPVHTALNIELAEGGINARLESAVAVPDSTEHKG